METKRPQTQTREIPIGLAVRDLRNALQALDPDQIVRLMADPEGNEEYSLGNVDETATLWPLRRFAEEREIPRPPAPAPRPGTIVLGRSALGKALAGNPEAERQFSYAILKAYAQGPPRGQIRVQIARLLRLQDAAAEAVQGLRFAQGFVDRLVAAGMEEEGEDAQRLRLGALAAEKLQTALETLIPKE